MDCDSYKHLETVPYSPPYNFVRQKVRFRTPAKRFRILPGVLCALHELYGVGASIGAISHPKA